MLIRDERHLLKYMSTTKAFEAILSVDTKKGGMEHDDRDDEDNAWPVYICQHQ